MQDDDRLEQILSYAKKTYRWVVLIGVITIAGILLSFCAALLPAT